MPLIIIWILLSAWLSVTGWILSALHVLNGSGYLSALAITAVIAWLCRAKWWPARGFHWPGWRKLRWRFSKPAPLIVLAISLLALMSGCFHYPENGDSNAYRIPRVLQWLGNSGWTWIRTDDVRENIGGAGYEWLCAPLILLARSERWIFLPNVIAYLLLPGLLFSFFRRLQIGFRSAWWWAWLTASGWCYTMQACSTDNDSLATVYALAALVFALRARESKRWADLGVAVLAAAVMTAIKPTNIPLLLPCFIGLLPSWPLVLRRPAMTTLLLIIAALASYLPTVYLNWTYSGSLQGYIPGPDCRWGSAFALPSPFWGIAGNLFYLPVQNLLPPFFPWAPAWNQAMQQFLQTPLGSHFIYFESFGRLNRSVSPVSAGLGLGIVSAILVSMPFILRRRQAGSQPRMNIFFLLRWTPWIALLAFMAKVGASQNARYLAAYYPFLLLPLVWQPAMSELVRRRWWQKLVLLVLLFTLALMGFNLGRHFVPSSVFAYLQASPHRPNFLKVLDDYYRTRLSVAAYKDFTSRHSAHETVVGYATVSGGLEPSMWQPWRHGRVERILPNDTPEWARTRGIHYIFIEDSALQQKKETIEQWLKQFDAEIVDQMTFTTDPGAPLVHLYFCRLNESNEPPAAGLPEGRP